MPPPVRIEDALPYRIHRCARLLRKHFHGLAAARGLDLSQEQWFVLNKLRHQDGRTQVELCDAIFADKPNITRMVAALEERGCVVRKGDPVDGRKQRVFLTKEGRRLHDAFADMVPDARRDLLRGVSAADVAAVERVLAAIERNAT